MSHGLPLSPSSTLYFWFIYYFIFPSQVFPVTYSSTAVGCGLPPSPPRTASLPPSLTSNRAYQDRIYYTCQDGFIMRGDLSSVCLETGQWSSVRGQCSSEKFEFITCFSFALILFFTFLSCFLLAVRHRFKREVSRHPREWHPL